MPSCSNALPSSEIHERTSIPEDKEEESKEDEEEDDAAFNPFLKETLSQEASSSLSSEVDGLDGHVVNSEPSVDTKLSKPTTKEKICTAATAVYSDHGEEGIILQTSAMISQSETNQEKQSDLTSEIDGYGPRIGELSNTTKSRSPEVPTSEENVAEYTTSMEKPCEPGNNSDTQADDSLHTNDTSLLNMALISEGKDDKSNSSWLSLDSSNTADDPMVQDQGSGVFTKPQKPGKRSGKWNASLNIGLTVERSRHDGNHKDG